MRTRSLVGVILVTLVAAACQKETNPWFTGGLDAALAAAQARGTLVFLDFYSPT